jgi:hypothetical protein
MHDLSHLLEQIGFLSGISFHGRSHLPGSRSVDTDTLLSTGYRARMGEIDVAERER